MMLDKSNSMVLSFDNGVTWIDATRYVRQESLTIDIRAMNDVFHMAQNTASFDVIYSDELILPMNKTIHELIREAEMDILTQIVHWAPLGSSLGGASLGGTTLSSGVVDFIDMDTGDNLPYTMFCGRAKPAIRRLYNGIANNTIIRLDFTDSSELLDVPCGDIVYRKTITDSWYIYKPSDTDHSIVHQLALIAGWPLSKCHPDVLINIEMSVFAPENEDDSIQTLIDTLLHEYGYALSFDESDRLKPYKWQYVDADPVYMDFDEENIGDPLDETVNVRQYDAAELTYFEIGNKDNMLVYRDGNLPYDPSGGFAGYAVPAGYYYPIAANTIDDVTGTNQIVYQPYEDNGIKYFTNKAVVNNLDIFKGAVSSDFSSIVATYDHTLEWQSSNSDLNIVSATYGNKKARVLLRNTGAVDRDLYYLNIRAGVVYRTSERKIKSGTGTGKKTWKYTAQFINDATTAATYTSAMMAQYKAKNINYVFSSIKINDVGRLVRVVLADGTSDKCIVMGRAYDQSKYMWRYTLKRYSTTEQAITQQTVYAFSAQVPETAPYVGQYKGAHTSVPVMQKGDWFLYTGVTTGSLTYGKLYVSA